MLSNTTDLLLQNDSTPICEVNVEGHNFILVAYVCFGLVLFGIPANILTICVLKSDAKRNTACYLMLVLATQDLILLIFYALYYIVPLLYDKHRWFSFCIKVIRKADSPILFLLVWFKFAEAYTIVSISFDRFIALRYPFKSARICTVSNAKRIQIVIVLVGLFIKLPILILDFCYHDESLPCDTCVPIFVNQPWYKMFSQVYIQIFDQIVTFIVPLLCLLFVNIYLIWKLQSVEMLKEFDNKSPQIHRVFPEISSEVQMENQFSSSKNNKHLKPLTPRLGRLDHYRQQNDSTGNDSYSVQLRRRWRSHQARNISAMLICVISVFIVCETPTALYFFYQLHEMIWKNEDEPKGAQSLYAIALFTAILNFGSNFLIYGLVGRRFRWLLRQTISRWTYMCLHCKRRKPARRQVQKRMLQTIRMRHNIDNERAKIPKSPSTLVENNVNI
ncbi:hypothetical protein ACTXT7_008178 [Hymenolepis weldensis]